MSNTTLPTDSKDRKNYPLLSGCLKYFPAALAGIAKISKLGNDKHNPGQEMHHARNKSMDHGDCILRHLVDTEDLLATYLRRQGRTDCPVKPEDVLVEASQLAWRALAYSQMLHEKFGAPLAPGAVEADGVAPKEATRLSLDTIQAILSPRTILTPAATKIDNEFGTDVAVYKREQK